MNPLSPYLPIAVVLGVAGVLAVAISAIATFLGPKRFDPIKFDTFECGNEPIGSARQRFSVKFYLVAMLFILFDIEVVFLYPWAVVYREVLAQNAPLILGSMASFVGILFIGYLYALKKGALDWKS